MNDPSGHHIFAADRQSSDGKPDAWPDDEGRNFFRGCLIAALPSALLWWGMISLVRHLL